MGWAWIICRYGSGYPEGISRCFSIARADWIRMRGTCNRQHRDIPSEYLKPDGWNQPCSAVISTNRKSEYIQSKMWDWNKIRMGNNEKLNSSYQNKSTQPCLLHILSRKCSEMLHRRIESVISLLSPSHEYCKTAMKNAGRIVINYDINELKRLRNRSSMFR